MLAHTSTGTSANDVQIQVPVHKFQARLIHNADITEALLDAVLVQIKVVTNAGTRPITPGYIKLRTLFEISQSGEGVTVRSPRDIFGSINIGVGGSIALGNNDYIQIAYRGLASANMVLKFYTFDVPIVTSALFKIDELVVTKAKEFSLENIHTMYIPVNDANGYGLDEITLQYSNRSITYTKEEIEMFQYSINDLCVVAQPDKSLIKYFGAVAPVAYYGFDTYLMLGVKDCISAKITNNTDAANVTYLLESVQ